MNKLMLTITAEEDGKIGVNGPLDNEFLCYGLLEKARQVIQAYQVQLMDKQKTLTPMGPRVVEPVKKAAN